VCGIAGILRFDGGKVEAGWLKQMAEELKHRGPDGEGYYVDSTGRFGLAFRRLAIIDLATGDQPMCNEDGSIWIVMNGEIYNFIDLRRQLDGHGHYFKSQSDTESLLHAYEEWGPDCLERLRGMFAFLILDLRSRKAFFARDRLGIKPFYYSFQNRIFTFASELKAFHGLPFLSREIHIPGLIDYLRFGYVPSPETIFKGWHKLPPACAGVIDFSREGSADVGPLFHRYWKPRWKMDEKPTLKEWMKRLEEKLKDSVSAYLVSDVPVGAFLSGGTDSSTVVAFMAQAAGKERVKTFSIGYQERFFSELPYARLVAKKFETESMERVVTPEDLERAAERLPEVYDEPFADPSALPTYCVSRLAREKVKVALSGDGGDELFAGYGRYRKVLKLTRGGFSFLKWRFSPIHPLEVFENSQRVFTDEQIQQTLLPEYSSYIQPSEYFLQFFEEGAEWDLLSTLQHIDLMTYLPENNLTKVDRASMAHGLEVRVPFLDHEVVELAVAIPPELRLRGKQRKYVLKKVMESYLPRRVLYRKKRGFSIPLRLWMKGGFLKKVKESLLSPEMRNFTNERGVMKLLKEQERNPRRMSARLWALFFFSQWLRVQE